MNDYVAAPLMPVVYSEPSENFVKAYNSRQASAKSGADWDDNESALLLGLKREVKKHYLYAQNYTCAYCRQKIVVDHNGAWDTDHIVPKDSYPAFMFVPENLCLSCKDCNGAKSNKRVLVKKDRKRFPRNSKDYMICHPHFDVYDEHVKIVGQAVLYLPITKKGQALIEMCGLLRFVYGFAGYEIADLNFGDKIVELGTAIQNAKSEFERIATAHILKTMLDEGLRVAALKRLSLL